MSVTSTGMTPPDLVLMLVAAPWMVSPRRTAVQSLACSTSCPGAAKIVGWAPMSSSALKPVSSSAARLTKVMSPPAVVKIASPERDIIDPRVRSRSTSRARSVMSIETPPTA